MVLTDGTPENGWEAIVVTKVCEDVYSVRLAADQSTRVVHRSGLQLKLESKSEVARHIESQVEAEVQMSQTRIEEARRLKLEHAKALHKMKEEVCCVQ